MKLSKIVKRLRFRILIVAVILGLLIACGLYFLHRWEINRGEFPEQSFGDETLIYEGKEYSLKTGIETFLLIGLDKFSDQVSDLDSYNNDKQADLLMLFVLDNDTRSYKIIHINRDTMAPVNVLGVAGNKIDTVVQQIALSHTYGNGRDVSCHNTMESVSAVLGGVRINHFVSITMDAVSILNDLIGGVEVEVLDDFAGIDDTLIKGETVTLMGEQALTYVRTRKGLDDATNASRMKRQQQYLDSFRKTLDIAIENNTDLLVEASTKVSDHVISDRSITQLQRLAEKFADYEFLGICELDGESTAGEKYMEFHVDEQLVKKMVVELFYELKK